MCKDSCQKDKYGVEKEMTSKINVDGKEYDLKNLHDRSAIFHILKEKMKGCDTDYYQVQGDFAPEIKS